MLSEKAFGRLKCDVCRQRIRQICLGRKAAAALGIDLAEGFRSQFRMLLIKFGRKNRIEIMRNLRPLPEA